MGEIRGSSKVEPQKLSPQKGTARGTGRQIGLQSHPLKKHHTDHAGPGAKRAWRPQLSDHQMRGTSASMFIWHALIIISPTRKTRQEAEKELEPNKSYQPWHVGGVRMRGGRLQYSKSSAVRLCRRLSNFPAGVRVESWRGRMIAVNPLFSPPLLR